VPSAFQEAVATRRLLNDANRQRAAKLLAQIDLDAASCARLTTPAALRAGQRVLRQECIYCHDLRTVLAKPRTPENWRQTVQRMADLTTVLRPIDQESQLLVTAYLIALSPDLQQWVRQLRQEQHRQSEARQADGAAAKPSPATAYDAEAARQLFEEECSQCHEAIDVEKATLDSEQSVRELVAAMVDEGMEATDEELSQLVRYLTDSYVKAKE
jgi:cytochrome c2